MLSVLRVLNYGHNLWCSSYCCQQQTAWTHVVVEMQQLDTGQSWCNICSVARCQAALKHVDMKHSCHLRVAALRWVILSLMSKRGRPKLLRVSCVRSGPKCERAQLISWWRRVFTIGDLSVRTCWLTNIKFPFQQNLFDLAINRLQRTGRLISWQDSWKLWSSFRKTNEQTKTTTTVTKTKRTHVKIINWELYSMEAVLLWLPPPPPPTHTHLLPPGNKTFNWLQTKCPSWCRIILMVTVLR